MTKFKTVAFIGFAIFSTTVFAIQNEKVLLDQEVEVLRSDFKEFHFFVPEDTQKKLEFRGSFKTSGGFNDDISFLVLTQGNYVRWLNHHSYNPLFKVEKKHSGSFRIEAKAGETYYFILDNFFSTVTNKKVKLKITLVPASAP